MRAPSLILDFLNAVRLQTRASSVTLLLHMEPPERQSILLLGDGEADRIPEFATEHAAWEFIRAQAERDHTEGGTELLTVVPSSNTNSMLVRVAFDSILARSTSARREVNERRREPEIITAPAYDGAIWFGLNDCADLDSFLEALEPADLSDAQQDSSTSTRPPFTNLAFVNLATRLAWSVYQLTGSLQDPISQLPGRMEFRVFLSRVIASARENDQWISLLLVNPDDFSMINHRYGREQGDMAIREIADQLSSSLRQTDGVFHYGGAVFGIVLPATDVEQCRAAAEKVRRQLVQRKYGDDLEHLTFSIGGVAAGPKDFADMKLEAADLLKSVDAALNRAKLSGGSRILVSDISDENSEAESLNAFSGIFSADTEKDYRNMLLLWEAVGLVSANPEPNAMARALVDRLSLGFRPDRIALYQLDQEELLAMATNVRDESQPDGRISDTSMSLDQASSHLVRQALDSGQTERVRFAGENSRDVINAYAVPLIAGEQAIGCLYLDGSGRSLELDSSDVLFLNALATQMAIALDRAELAANWIREKDRERRQLQSELQELRQSLPQSEMVYESAEMLSLMETLERVAPTDATILIIGESGTGKEMLAHSIHEFSTRKDKPFVVFDCGAVTHSLLEAELFGHVKGAFTGAESASTGRISQADGGTLFLDEIGELPLQVQAKLLRFVQEKEFSAVGSTQNQKVDVRIVAATNRELQDEVAAGRFRSDLYYRLQVIALNAVPLRYRTADILPLANHFLGRFSAEYSDEDGSFTEQAQQKLLDYEWPGNVRELQNSVLRAVLTSGSDQIDAGDIEFLPDSLPRDSATAPAIALTKPVAAMEAAPEFAPRPEESGRPCNVDPWEELETELTRQIKTALHHNGDRPVPLGRWLTEEFVLVAGDMNGNVATRAAQVLGIAETTYRRHFQKATADLNAGLVNRTADWETVHPLIKEIIEDVSARPEPDQSDLIERARTMLLGEVERFVDSRASVGAALMGVSSPTYKRWTQTRLSA